MGCWRTFRRLRPIPEAARKSSRNSASLSSMLKSHSLVIILDPDAPSATRIFAMRRLRNWSVSQNHRSRNVNVLKVPFDLDLGSLKYIFFQTTLAVGL